VSISFAKSPTFLLFLASFFSGTSAAEDATGFAAFGAASRPLHVSWQRLASAWAAAAAGLLWRRFGRRWRGPFAFAPKRAQGAVRARRAGRAAVECPGGVAPLRLHGHCRRLRPLAGGSAVEFPPRRAWHAGDAWQAGRAVTALSASCGPPNRITRSVLAPLSSPMRRNATPMHVAPCPIRAGGAGAATAAAAGGTVAMVG